MKKEEYIKRYGKEAHDRWLQQGREWKKNHPEEATRTRLWQLNHPEETRASRRLWCSNNPEKITAVNQEASRKGGKYYDHHRQHQMTGIPHERELVRKRHSWHYTPYKKIIAPDSQIHHEWIPETANYRGVALVEKDQHIHGFIDVIQILEGEITLLSEEEIRNRRT